MNVPAPGWNYLPSWLVVVAEPGMPLREVCRLPSAASAARAAAKYPGAAVVRGPARHSKFAPHRFADQVAPALESFTAGRASTVVAGVDAAKAARVADNDDEATTWLRKRGFSGAQASNVVTSVLALEHHPARSVWDMVQGITAVARDVTHQDQRVALERAAGRILDKVS